MKRFKNLLLISIMILMVALPAALYAQEPEPEAVTKGFVEAVNKGDVDDAEAKMKEDASVTVPKATAGEEGEAEAEADPAVAAEPKEIKGKAEIRAWLEAQAKANASTTVGECTVEGEIVICDVDFSSANLKAKGIDALEGTIEVKVVDGLVQSYNFTPSVESAAVLQAAYQAPETLPTTGGTLPATGGTTQGATYMVLAAILGLLLIGGAFVTRVYQRGAKN